MIVTMRIGVDNTWRRKGQDRRLIAFEWASYRHARRALGPGEDPVPTGDTFRAPIGSGMAWMTRWPT